MSGSVDVVVRLSQPAVAGRPSSLDPHTAADAENAQQDHLLAAARPLGAGEQARLHNDLNAVILRVDASKLTALARIDGVVSVRPVGQYELAAADAGRAGALARAAQYLKVDALRARGLDGAGVRAAVIDSGIDYTHGNLGGPGTLDAYQACYAGADPAHPAYAAAPTGACAALFGPDAPKVKGGYDFVGEQWPNGPLLPDPNPIDAEGHGTHVADILGGRSTDGQHLGIAPGVSLYAYKACSALTQQCNGAALLQAMDRALDPNGDGDLSDHVDIVNLSLGQNYGEAEDDLSLAVENATRAGVTVVASAGNGGNRPYIVSGPATALGAIAVAQTALPDKHLLPFTVTGATGLVSTVRYALPQPWAPEPTAVVSARLTTPVTILGCGQSDWITFPRGAVALVQRGTCPVTSKVDLARRAGAAAVVLYDNVDEAPLEFLYGGGDPSIPTVVISRAAGQGLLGLLGAGLATFRLDPAAAVNLAGSIESTSARGPSLVNDGVKPDLAAPGDWISADAGKGTGDSAFGGTSGAAPVVAGIAAVLKQARPTDRPADLKRRVVSSAKTSGTSLDDDGNAYPSPITRTGGGEVVAVDAADAVILAGDSTNGDGNLSFGFRAVNGETWVKRFVDVTNTADVGQMVHLELGFRDPSEANGAVTIATGRDYFVQPHGTSLVPIILKIDGTKLPAWPITGLAGAAGDQGRLLDGPEVDGYLTVTPEKGPVATLGWEVLARRSSGVAAPGPVTLDPDGTGQLTLVNKANVEPAQVQPYDLLGVSPRLPAPQPGQPGSPGSNLAVVDLQAVGARTATTNGTPRLDVLVASYDRRATPDYPAAFQIDIDTNNDGTPDKLIFNQELSGFGTDGRNEVFIVNLPDTTPVPIGFTTADFHASDVLFSLPLSLLGIAPGQTIRIDAFGADSYFNHSPRSQVTDSILGMTYTVGASRYVVGDGSAFDVPVPWGARVRRTVHAVANPSPSSQTGFLLALANDANQDTLVVPVS